MNIRHRTIRVSYRGGGGNLGNPPPKASFPPPKILATILISGISGDKVIVVTTN